MAIIASFFSPKAQRLATSGLQIESHDMPLQYELLQIIVNPTIKSGNSWRPGPDGVRVKDGTRLQLTLYPNPYLATSKAVDELVAQQLRRLGVDVDIQAFDVVTYGEMMTGYARARGLRSLRRAQGPGW